MKTNRLTLIRGWAAALLLAVALLLPQAAAAYSFMVGGLCYNRNSDGTSVTVTYQTTSSPRYTDLSGDLVIPATVTYSGTTYSVTSIGSYAFTDCSGLTSVTIPNSVTSIVGSAFSGCSGLTSVTIPNSVTYIGNNAFYGTAWYNNQPYGLVYVGLIAYRYKGTMPSGTSIEILEGTKNISPCCFQNCSGLASVTIGNSVTSIGGSAFQGCSGLTSVTIPNSVTSIVGSAFSGCSGLTSVTIPNSVTYIGNNAFYGTAWYNNQPYGLVYVGLIAYRYKGTMPSGTSIEILEGTKNISPCCFQNCSGLASVTIGNSVTSIGGSAFQGCSGLTSVTIPNSVTSIGNYAFNGCSGLTSVTIPNSVTSIGGSAFSGCSGLTDINSYIENPTNVTLGSGVFYDVPTNACVLHVPVGTVADYRAASQWSAFTNIVELEPPTVQATSVTLNETAAELTAGETLQLTATVLPENATDRTVTWTSSDPAVATVDATGLVTAVAAGTATITATTSDGSALAATCQVTVEASAANQLMVENYTVLRGHSLTLPVQLANTANNLTALQADIHLPEGIGIEMDGDEYVIDLVSDRVARDHTLSSNRLASGAVRVLIASPTKKLFTGNSGDLFTISLLTSDEMSAGDYALTIDNIILSDNEATTYHAPDVTSTITVKDVEMGDVNGDGNVTVSDVVLTAQKAVGMSPDPFNEANADVNGDGNINVTDVVIIANIAVGAQAAPRRAPMLHDADMNRLTASELNIHAGESQTVMLALDNATEFTAFQMQMTLPEGLTIEQARLSDRAGSHSLLVNNADGTTRLLGFSAGNDVIEGNDGVLVEVTLKAEGNFDAYSAVKLSDMVFVEPNGTAHQLDDLMLVNGIATGVEQVNTTARIYGHESHIVIEAAESGLAQIVMANGMSRTVKVAAGRNVVPMPAGMYIVKMNNAVAKIKL